MTIKAKSGLDVRGELRLQGSLGTTDDVAVGGAQASFTAFPALQLKHWGAIPALAPRSAAPRKVLVLGFGNSNWLGQAAVKATDLEGVHKPIDGVMEVSRGLDQTTYHAPAAGTLMRMRIPNQDSFNSDTGLTLDRAGPKMAALKRVKELDPTIDEIAILTCGIGGSGLVGIAETGYRDPADWAVGSTALTDMVSEANAFLAANPDYTCDWIACQLGPICGFAETSGVAFRGLMLATLAHIRANVTGAANAVFTIHSIHPNLVATNLSATNGLGNGTMPEVEAEILGFAAYDPLGLTVAIDVSDLTATDDGKHHTEADFTTIGRRHGEAYFAARAARTAAPRAPGVRMLPSADAGGSFRDALGGSCRIHGETLEQDPQMGTVLRADGTLGSGFQTDIPINNAAHTIFARVKFLQAPVGELSLFAGKSPSQSSIGRLCSIRTIAYQGTGSALDPLLETGKANALVQSKWHSIAIRFNGTQFSVFKDGAQVVAPTTSGAAVVAEPTILELMDYGDGAVGTTPVNARMTDIRVVPYAATDAEIAAWHADRPLVGLTHAAILTAQDEFGTAISLGTNPTAGNSWKDQIRSGVFWVNYTGASNLSTDDDLPWDPNVFSGNVNANATWLVELRVIGPTVAYATATSLGLSGGTTQVVRSWRAFLTKASTASTWGFLGTGEKWHELTRYDESPDGTLYRLDVANGGAVSGAAL